ncbi:hypothetical protein [Nocardia brevicatena]|uniref:hypothetical protein n=1 Tax=Nocardia brevicatena TaxID=37327 RepID=UPI00031A8668|nr:hypothetical protein [Nocardia brevicatena]
MSTDTGKPAGCVRDGQAGRFVRRFDSPAFGIATVVSLPFLLVMGAMCVALYRDLRADPMIQRQPRAAELVESAVVRGAVRHEGEFELVTEPVGGPAEPVEELSAEAARDPRDQAPRPR